MDRLSGKIPPKDFFPLGQMFRNYIERRQEQQFWVPSSQNTLSLSNVRGKILAYLDGGNVDLYGAPYAGNFNYGDGDQYSYDTHEDWSNHYARLLQNSLDFQPSQPKEIFVAQSSGYFSDIIGFFSQGSIHNPRYFRGEIKNDLQDAFKARETLLYLPGFDRNKYMKGVFVLDFPDRDLEILPLIRMSIYIQKQFYPSTTPIVTPTQTPTTGSNSFKSFHGTYLSGNQDGTVSLKYNL